jgi:glutathione-regulated potassium-efflux system ancillary protein KefG
MNKILILFAHPVYEKSRVQLALVRALPKSVNITFHDLYELYPDFNILLSAEKELLLRHDIIIWQHPFYWYSIPPLLKQWIDVVLEYGWAYGPGGEALKGKTAFNIITAGGREEAYSSTGRNRYEVDTFLTPLKQTVRLCNMVYLPPFVVHGTHLLKPEEIKAHAIKYAEFLRHLVEIPLEELNQFEGKYLNELIIKKES